MPHRRYAHILALPKGSHSSRPGDAPTKHVFLWTLRNLGARWVEPQSDNIAQPLDLGLLLGAERRHERRRGLLKSLKAARLQLGRSPCLRSHTTSRSDASTFCQYGICSLYPVKSATGSGQFHAKNSVLRKGLRLKRSRRTSAAGARANPTFCDVTRRTIPNVERPRQMPRPLARAIA